MLRLWGAYLWGEALLGVDDPVYLGVDGRFNNCPPHLSLAGEKRERSLLCSGFRGGGLGQRKETDPAVSGPHHKEEEGGRSKRREIWTEKQLNMEERCIIEWLNERQKYSGSFWEVDSSCNVACNLNCFLLIV